MSDTTEGPQPPTIFTIPVELAQRILALCHPWDVAAFSQTCRLAYDLVNNFDDEYLWRQLWHAYPFDDPLMISEQRQEANLSINTSYPIRWKDELTRRLKAELMATKRTYLSIKGKKDALQTLASLIREAPPAPLAREGEDLFETPASANIQWVERVLRGSRLLAPGSSLIIFDDTPEMGHIQAHLRSCMGDIEWIKSRRLSADRRNKSRSFVYNLRNYTSETDYGPFRRNGNVNWIHVEHLIDVVLSNLRDLPSNWTLTRPPLGLESVRPYSAPGIYSQADWAGVEGTWRRYVCFMDYRDLFAFNVLHSQYSTEDGPLHPKFFEDPRFREATRLIEVKLRIVPQRAIRFYNSSEILPTASPKHPTLFFTGSSKGVNGNEAVVEGYVRMASDETVRWKFKVSVYDSSPQWSSNGVQIGDVASAKGVIGIWTTTTHEQGDPVGPFWLWKVEDDCPEDLMEDT